MHPWLLQRFRTLPPFVQKAALSFGLRFNGLAIQFLISILVTRLLGAQSFGAFIYAFVWAIMLGTFLTFGLSRLAVREIPRFVSESDHGRARGYLLLTIATILAGGVLTGLLLMVLERASILVLAPGWLLVTAVAIAHALILSLSGIMAGFQMIVWSNFIENIFRQLVYAGLIGLCLLAGITLTPQSLFAVNLAASLPTLLLMGLLILAALRRHLPEAMPVRIDARYWFLGAMPLLLSVFADFFNTNLDILMIGSLMGDLETGIYRAAVRGALLVSIANMVSLQVLGPMLSRALAQKDTAGAQRFLAYSALVSLAVAFTLCALLALAAHPFLALFGPEFPEAATAMRILLAGMAVNVLAGGGSILLVMLNRETRVLMINLAGLALNVVLNAILIRLWGIEGAAAATSLTLAFVALAILHSVKRESGFDPTVFSAWRLWRARRARRAG